MPIQIKRRPAVNQHNLPKDIPDFLQQIYAARGITEPQELENGAKYLANFQDMHGLDEATALLIEALEKQHKVVIVGDFDADGATSTALLMRGLPMFGLTNVDFMVPNRFDFGYGLSPEMAEQVVNAGADLLITVDNGISCHQGVALAKSAGVKVLITDHHLPGATLPDADAIVNPNQPNCKFASKNLAGVGVAFYVLVALRAKLRSMDFFNQQNVAEPNIANLLDLVALGTVADVVELDGNNRILVYQGLQRIRKGQCCVGIKALIDIANRHHTKLHESDFGFALGPRLNAAGRLDDMSLGITCLITDDMSQARRIADELDTLNKTRREIEQGMQAEAEKVIAKLPLQEGIVPDAITLFQDDWHQGVIGIVAGRIKEKYHRPVIAFACSDNENQAMDTELKGSARSITGIHIRDMLDEVNTRFPNLIIKFGGHAAAAGLSIQKDKLAEFTHAFEQVISEHMSDEQRTGSILTDGALPPNLMTLDVANTLKHAGPWGQAFPEPIFDDFFTVIQQRIVGEKHLKLVLEHASGHYFDAIHFNCDLAVWPDLTIKSVHVVYALDINEFRDKLNLQLMVKEIQITH
ncbi:single-stranded-DNA-specific exonuclease RecJ [Flocculibacter collagenilyticus]|uniref:single-stranded-DNA-specific exonuclease RecJ n=1 Tax=Flocculibacter collagenilyticus TaxID=2744479 RepID=UPI0018F28F0E|nr:single-stranded-DNA-specific exonuclease RecJ [Flocculibacter collagenilyticus]